MKIAKTIITIFALLAMAEGLFAQESRLFAIGDVGQIDPWFQQSLKHKIALKMKKGVTDAAILKRVDDYANKIGAEIKSEKLEDATPPSRFSRTSRSSSRNPL